MFRGLSANPSNFDHVVSSLKSGCLTGENSKWGSWHIRHPNPSSLAARSDLAREMTEVPRDDPNRTPVTFACGDEGGAGQYAWRSSEGTNKVPIIVEFDVDMASAVVDGRDTLYTLIHIAHHPEARLMMEMGWGAALRPYLARAAEGVPVDVMHALVDLACTDPDVIRAHHSNQTLIIGRMHTMFRSAFMIPARVAPEAIRKVWVLKAQPTWSDSERIPVYTLMSCLSRRS